MHQKLILILCGCLVLTACSSNNRHVPRHHGYTTIEHGTIIAVEDVTIGGSRSGIGAYVGSAAAIHDSTSHHFLGLVLRGLAGAFVGSTVEEALTRRPGSLYTIELKSGELIEVLSRGQELQSGDCASVRFSGRRHTSVTKAKPRQCAVGKKLST